MLTTEEAVEMRQQLKMICARLDAAIERQTQPNRGLGVVMAPAGFQAFWQSYPRKVKEKAAAEAWAALAPDRALTITIMGALAQHKVSWVGKAYEFIPLPANWLIERRWLDKLDGVPLAPEKPKRCPRCNIGGPDYRPTVLSQDGKTLICRQCSDEEQANG